MIRFLLALVVLYFFYWLVTKDSKSKAKAKQRKRPQTPSPSHLILDEMKRCPTCDTFNPKSYAYLFKNEYYCDAQCAQKRKSSS